MSITRDSVESAYCFFHQKWRIYAHSTIEWQKEDIEYSISSYVQSMNRLLYESLAQGKADFLTDHSTFAADMRSAVQELERMIDSPQYR